MLPCAEEMIAARSLKVHRIRMVQRRGYAIFTGVQQDCMDLCVWGAAKLTDLEDIAVEPWPCEVPIPHSLLS